MLHSKPLPSSLAPACLAVAVGLAVTGLVVAAMLGTFDDTWARGLQAAHDVLGSTRACRMPAALLRLCVLSVLRQAGAPAS